MEVWLKENVNKRAGGTSHTQLFVFIHGFIMSTPKLSPLCEFILRAGVVHVSFQLEGFALQPALFPRILRS